MQWMNSVVFFIVTCSVFRILISFLARRWVGDLMEETVGQREVPRCGLLIGHRFVELWRMKERKINAVCWREISFLLQFLQG